MLSPRWCKVWADLCGAKTRTALVVLSIFVGVFVVGAVAGARFIFARDMDSGWNASRPANATVYADQYDEEIVLAARNIRGVEEAEGRRNFEVRVRIGADQWKQLVLVVIPDYHRIKINKVKPLSGAWPPPEREMLVERASFPELGVAEGQLVEIETPDGKRKTLKVAGRVHDVGQIPTLFTGRLYGYITFDTLEALGEPRKLDQLNIRVKEAAAGTLSKADIEPLARRAWDKVEQSDVKVYWLEVFTPGEHVMNSAIQALLAILTVLGGLSLLLGAFLLVNTISAILTQQIRQVGVMKAIGASTGQLLGMYLTLVLGYSLLAVALAIPAGALAAYGIAMFMAGLFNFDVTGAAFNWQVIALQVVVGVTVPLLAALYPTLHGARRTVREAISDYGLGAGNGFGAHRVDHLIEKIRGIPRPLLLSLRNTFRRKGRLALTLGTLITAGVVFIAVMSVRNSLYLTNQEAMEYFNYDVSINFIEPQRLDKLALTALQTPGVTAVEGWGYAAGRLLFDDRPDDKGASSEKVGVMAPPAASVMLKPRMVSGRWLLPEDENALVINSDVRKKRPDLKVGDVVTLKIGSRKSNWQIVGVAQSVLTGPLVYANYPYYAQVVREAGRASSLQAATISSDAAFQRRTAEQLERTLKRAGFKVAVVETASEQKKRTEAQFDILILFLLAMAVLLAAVGGLGLMGSMGINVLERTREIGVMRAIGASDRAVTEIFVMEGLVIAGISWLISLLLSIPVSRVMSDQVGRMFMENPLSYSFSYAGAGIWLILVILLAAAASFLPARKAARLRVREVLNYE